MNDVIEKTRPGWGEALLIYTKPRVLGMLLLGFSAGLPYLLVFGTLSAWLTDAGVTRTVIGFFSWIGIAFSIKVFWAPIIDRLQIPLLTKILGRRRSWMLVAQVGIAAGLVGMAMTDPAIDITQMALFALLVAFSSATQDIVIDAYRIEAVDKTYQGAMAATYIAGYRVAVNLIAGALALYLADNIPWSSTYLIMALLMGVGLITTLIIKEPEASVNGYTNVREQRVIDFIERSAHLPVRYQQLVGWFIGAVVCPFTDFFQRNGVLALLILAFISIYRLSDITMGVMAYPFYLDLGFSKTEIAGVAKIFGLGMTLFGAAAGGLLVVRYGIMKPLLLGAILVPITNLLFAFLAKTGPDIWFLAVVISADNFSGGLAIAAFIAYLSSLTNTAYTATQYALFSSLMTLFPKIIGGFSGVIVDAQGYFFFFVYAAVIGIPAILLVLYLMRAMNLDQLNRQPDNS